jgi:alpha-D-ribose 1-methylphosphonate 5-triphosphate diphosphatase
MRPSASPPTPPAPRPAAAVALAAEAPARIVGLADRGRIAEGLRADLAAVRLVDGQPVVTAVWREGRQVH